MSQTILIPSNYGCIALLNPKRYTFLREDGILYTEDLLDDYNSEKIFLWGVPRGNWKVKIDFSVEIPQGFRSLKGCLVSDGELCFYTYDDLNVFAVGNATSKMTEMPEEWTLPVKEGRYVCTVVQLYDPQRWDDNSVWNEPLHYHLSLVESAEQVEPAKDFPWENFSENSM